MLRRTVRTRRSPPGPFRARRTVEAHAALAGFPFPVLGSRFFISFHLQQAVRVARLRPHVAENPEDAPPPDRITAVYARGRGADATPHSPHQALAARPLP